MNTAASSAASSSAASSSAASSSVKSVGKTPGLEMKLTEWLDDAYGRGREVCLLLIAMHGAREICISFSKTLFVLRFVLWVVFLRSVQYGRKADCTGFEE